MRINIVFLVALIGPSTPEIIAAECALLAAHPRNRRQIQGPRSAPLPAGAATTRVSPARASPPKRTTSALFSATLCVSQDIVMLTFSVTMRAALKRQIQLRAGRAS